jgi:hypothetical protein
MGYNQIGLGYSSHVWPSLGSGWKSFEGLIDDVRLWSVARTQQEISDNMKVVLGGSEADLVGRWRLNEGVGQLAADSTQMGHHGTLGVDVSPAGDASDPSWAISDSPEFTDDCNENGLLDECDIAEGSSLECNDNGVPDECEFAGTVDCNGNGIVDLCEPGGANDCNGNDAPDWCDIAEGTSADCNENGVPDTCELFGEISGPPAEAIECPCNGHFYLLTLHMAWPEAEAYAVDLGCHLATIRNAEENQWILDTFASHTMDNGIYIGFNDVESEGNWVWSSGESATFTNWAPTEPNNLGNEDWGEFALRSYHSVSPGEWDDGRVFHRGLVELIRVGDCNGNDILDECDIGNETSHDCNENSVPDECEFAGTVDCNGNGIVDLCEPGGANDCNGNDAPDWCDIAEGASGDCNENGVPDECESDCNGNGVLDACDIAVGTSLDCNWNGVPDECDGDFENWALGFDGADDLVILPNDLLLSGNTLTLEAWFNTFGMGVIVGYQNAIYPSSPSNYVPSIYVGSDGRLRGKLWNGSASPPTTAFTVNDGMWHHVALVGNGNTQTLHVDGSQIGGPVEGSINHLDMGYNQIGLGHSSHVWPSLGSGWRSFGGLIDDVRLWHVARTEEEIRANMSSLPSGPHADLVGRWRLNEGIGQLATDASGNGNDGTLGVDGSSGGDGSDPTWTSSDSPEMTDDCNENGILDECDIAEGTSHDCDGNEVLDECEQDFVLCGGLDVRPSGCPNPLNRNSHGVLPVAVVGTDDFDVMLIEVSSVLLWRADGVGGPVAPNEGPPGPHSTFGDVATPFDGEACACHELSGDGIVDLVLKFRTDAVVEGLLLDDLNYGEQVELIITGTLIGGAEFTTAGDCVLIVPQGTSNANVTSNVAGLFVELSPPDLNVDGPGFADFQRIYNPGTVITLTAPARAEDLLFNAWLIDGVMQNAGETTIEITVVEDLTARALYLSATPGPTLGPRLAPTSRQPTSR